MCMTTGYKYIKTSLSSKGPTINEVVFVPQLCLIVIAIYKVSKLFTPVASWCEAMDTKTYFVH